MSRIDNISFVNTWQEHASFTEPRIVFRRNDRAYTDSIIVGHACPPLLLSHQLFRRIESRIIIWLAFLFFMNLNWLQKIIISKIKFILQLGREIHLRLVKLLVFQHLIITAFLHDDLPISCALLHILSIYFNLKVLTYEICILILCRFM